MRRRALLAALAAGSSALAGCSLLDGEETSRGTFAADVTTPEPTTAQPFTAGPDPLQRGFTRPTAATTHRVAITRPVDVPDGLAVTLGFSEPETVESPAKVYARVAVPEDADEAVSVPVGPTPPLSEYAGYTAEERRKLTLVPRRAGPADEDIVRRDRGCWRPVLPIGPEAGSRRERTLEPGESVGRDYFLVTPWATDRCMQPGAFQFRTDAGWSFHVASFLVVEPEASAFDDRTVPPLPGFQATRWYHETDGTAFLDPQAESVGLPRATPRFVFHNQLLRTFRAPAGAWRLYKLADGTWHHVAPLSRTDGQRRLLPGSTSTLQLSLFTDPDVPDEGERRVVGGLGQGTYAVAYPTSFTVPSVDRDVERDGPPAALFGVVGEEPPLEATGSVDHVVEDGDVIHVYTTADESAPATLRVEPVSNPAASPTRVVREQVLQRDALRDAIATYREHSTSGSGPGAVVYHTTAEAVERTTSHLDPEAEGILVAFEGTTFSLSYG